MKDIRVECIFYPGKYMDDHELNSLTEGLKRVAAKCFNVIPNYQALTGSREEYNRVVLAIAKNNHDEIVGFCSSLVLDIPHIGHVFHFGLTCVTPTYRGLKLTKKLSSKLLTQYLIKESLFKPIWISNVACVLSSLGNIAKYVDQLYPSPWTKKASIEHKIIAKEIDINYRSQIAINKEAKFNQEKFVFEGSVKGSCFKKSKHDKQFYHRNHKLNAFYINLLNFERGDEVLQIGRLSILSPLKFYLEKFKHKTSHQLFQFLSNRGIEI